MEWYYYDGGQQVGPVPEDRLRALRRAGTLTADTLVWRVGMANWATYRDSGLESEPAPLSAPIAALGAHEAACAECGKVFPKTDMIAHGASFICAACKPVFLQKLSEGVTRRPPGQLNYAGFWIRFGARMVDGILMAIVLYVPLFIIIFATGGNMGSLGRPSGEFGPHEALILAWQLGFYVIFAAYEIFFVGKYGATPGKMACRLKVVTVEGEPLTYGRATGRFFAYLLSGMICYIGYIIAGFDAEKRALHDHICSTRVVYKD
jgi:uncharacterized RDD family membrane protein YckC